MSDGELPPEYTRNGCDIDGYTLRGVIDDSFFGSSVTKCLNDCTELPYRQSNDVCKVSNEDHRCCFAETEEGTGLVLCAQLSESACALLDGNDTYTGKWCPLPAPPADDSGLSAGAIAGIAVGAVLVVVAAGVVLL